MRDRTRRLVALAAITLLAATSLAACGSDGPKGPDLIAVVDQVGNTTTATQEELGLVDPGIDQTWRSAGATAETADAIAAIARPDERADDPSGNVFLLYPSGTLWVSPIATGSAVALYRDNERAYNRHGGFLFLNNGWGSRMGSYRTSGGGSVGGNGFRGGGSSSGK